VHAPDTVPGEPASPMNPILCVGSHPNDVAPLITIARHARDRLGLDAVFSSVAPPDVASEVHRHVTAEGFATLDQSLVVSPPRNERNPSRRARRWRDTNLAVVEHVVSEVRPTAVLATVNPPPCLLLDALAERGVPSMLLQLWFWGDRSFRRAWRADDRRFQQSGASRRKRLRRQLEHGAEALHGIGETIEWNVRHATVAVQGPALRRQLVADGVPAERVVVTGNPVLDDLHRLRNAPDAPCVRVRAQLAIPDHDQVITHFRSHEDRFPKIDRRTREESQAAVIRSLREAAPDAIVVVKLHPKESDAERALIRSIDADVVVAGTDVEANDLIAASALVVGTFSTTLLQAVVLDRPAVSAMLWPDLDYWQRATDWSGVDRAADGPALTEAVRRHLGDHAYRAQWAARREEFGRDQFLVDGHGTLRVVDLLERLLQAQGTRS
jgi:CDP-Glycerol:Poly(glycerophosphate) glycerophosphotransferase